MKAVDKNAVKQWDEYVKALKEATTIDASESFADKTQRVKRLEKDPEAWFKYYFPNYAYAEPADFHKRATRRILKHSTHYEVRAWSRELAKSSRTMMETIYQALTGRVRNIMLISHTEDQATALLTPYRLNLEHNERITNDYGPQKLLGFWTDSKFKTASGCSFQAIGAGQSPRGAKNEWIRPDKLIFDDIDTDEEIRNTDRIAKKWEWIEQAVIPTVSVSMSKQIIFLGNIIGKDTCITRAIKVADHAEVINIRDAEGRSTWPNKNTEEDIDWMLSKVSYASGQKEYFNNPISTGDVFQSLTWGRIPRITSFRYLINYGDPAYSNNTTKQNSSKCVVLLGYHNSKYYIINCRLDKATNTQFVGWYNELQQLHNHEAVQHYNYVENNSLQGPFYEQVLQPEFKAQHTEIMPDDRKKPEKFVRVEGNLEPKNSSGRLIFNERERDNPHMKRLAEQFEAFNRATAKTLDGPDAVEGGVWVIDNKQAILDDNDIHIGSQSSKKF